MSPGKEADLSSIYLTRSSTADNEQLCSSEFLGLEDNPDGDQHPVNEEFKKSLLRTSSLCFTFPLRPQETLRIITDRLVASVLYVSESEHGGNRP